ncbi:MAG: AAA family ATPase, partial [Clostridia bacterium]|nr:AAA family ATPase [Clostridia bacterium]
MLTTARADRRDGWVVRHPGNDELFRAVAWSLAGLRRGWPVHLHAEGLRGTGKTTILRAARALLPTIRRIRGCLYNCDPLAPHCPEHRHLSPGEIAALGEEAVPAPFLEISPSAKIGTVVGSIDLTRVLDRTRPEASLLPGTLAQAHRGIVFIDEINRLADIAPELADALLDVMGTKPGRLQIEETGLPKVVLPVNVTVWAASNPDEDPGPLSDVRRQLADRFDLVVSMSRPTTVDAVKRILSSRHPLPAAGAPAASGMEGRGAGATASGDGAASAPPAAAAPAASNAAGDAVSVWHEAETDPGEGWPEVDEILRDFLACTYVRFQLESLRAVEAWQATARLAAACRRGTRVSAEDLLRTAAPVLRHRVDPQTLAEILAYTREQLAGGDAQARVAFGAELTPAGLAAEAAGEPGARGRPGREREETASRRAPDAADGGARAAFPTGREGAVAQGAREALDGRAAGAPSLWAGADAPAGDGPGARWSRLFEGMRHALRGRRSPAPDVPAPRAGGPPAAGR